MWVLKGNTVSMRNFGLKRLACRRFVSSEGKVESGTSYRPIYMDMQATTPLDPRVLDAMLPYLSSHFGNPHSRTHAYGWDSEKAVEKARKQVASLINADPKEVIFTSGATESNNMAVKGVANFYKGSKKHLMTLQTEHKCVLDSMRLMHERGFDVTYLPVESDGVVNVDKVKETIRPGETSLFSVMTANNEIGVLQPIKELAAMCRERGVFLHTDAAQAVGKIPVDVEDWGVDLMSISGHKLYGPKGIGAIYVRRRPRVRIEPIINGGGQERGLRSGTLPTALVVGLGAACEIAQREMEADQKHVDRLTEKLYDGFTNRVKAVSLNGSRQKRVPGNLNFTIAGVEGESSLMALKTVALSSGSACTSASLEPSYVLRALGVNEEVAHTSLRFGVGRFSTDAEVDYTLDLAVREIARLRSMSPLWEMMEEGIDLKTIQWSQDH